MSKDKYSIRSHSFVSPVQSLVTGSPQLGVFQALSQEAHGNVDVNEPNK